MISSIFFVGEYGSKFSVNEIQENFVTSLISTVPSSSRKKILPFESTPCTKYSVTEQSVYSRD